MVTENPADHCLYEIPLCIPACVTGEPSVSSHCGLFGRGVVEYCWPCGFEVIVKFRNIGDIRVDYEGDWFSAARRSRRRFGRPLIV
jgi:hypothetical protein